MKDDPEVQSEATADRRPVSEPELFDALDRFDIVALLLGAAISFVAVQAVHRRTENSGWSVALMGLGLGLVLAHAISEGFHALQAARR